MFSRFPRLICRTQRLCPIPGRGVAPSIWLLGCILICILGCFGVPQPVRGQAGLPEGPEEIAGMQALRGSLLKVTGNTYLIKTPQGVLYSVLTGANTHFVHGEEVASASAIHTGEMVLAGGELDEKHHTLGAVFLAAVDPQQLAEFDRRRAEFGKTWVAGTITSIHGTQLVLKRPDAVSTTVTVDENTSFRKRHESVTLADLQVGDGLTARGAMGKASFAGTLLTVVDAREIEQWSKLRDR